MIKALICFLWGHKNVVKACTGQQYEAIDRVFGVPTKGNYYVWEKKKFCLRCGKDLEQGKAS